MTRLLLDQGLAPQAALLLRQSGFDAIHTSEIGLERAQDTEILSTARSQDRICVTLDHDFHSHLALHRHPSPSVIFLRVQSLDAPAQADLIRAICHQCEIPLREGAAISADTKTLRIRRLPLR